MAELIQVTTVAAQSIQKNAQSMQQSEQSMQQNSVTQMGSLENTETQMGQLTDTLAQISRQPESFPSNTEPNPRKNDIAQCPSMTLRIEVQPKPKL
ncbi:hypothetical protein ACLOJK_007725, partial [Asimina triloba]